MKTVLTIAGSDSSGGAGIQADIKTITVHKIYAMSVITAVTAQNTMGVTKIMDMTPEMVAKQMVAVFEDIRPDAIKIGMVSDAEIIKVIASKLREYKAENIVIDPIMVATSGGRLLKKEAEAVLIEQLFPMATLITPNIPEAEVLSKLPIRDRFDMLNAAEKIASTYSCAVLIKGGHLLEDAIDLLYRDEQETWYSSERIDNPNTHGTGCTLSSAIACGLADKKSLEDSIRDAKQYLTGTLRAQLDIGKGSGPLNHMYKI
ncbi:MAG: bifunctional hydroxymethylpyrimidine kinase/phosphomethylpyrimidine kinase [bacterium]|nr:bifunctional hydroxymethylpyrimidine kinase/phosphomethylpyrimidine kinase [bacterium]